MFMIVKHIEIVHIQFHFCFFTMYYYFCVFFLILDNFLFVCSLSSFRSFCSSLDLVTLLFAQDVFCEKMKFLRKINVAECLIHSPYAFIILFQSYSQIKILTCLLLFCISSKQKISI